MVVDAQANDENADYNGSTLRNRLKAEMEAVLLKSSRKGKNAGVDGKVNALLVRPKTPLDFRPPARSTYVQESGVQAEIISEAAEEAIRKAPVMEFDGPAPEPKPKKEKVCRLVRKEEKAVELREETHAAMRRLGQLDAEVTRLTRSLRMMQRTNMQTRCRWAATEEKISVFMASSLGDGKKAQLDDCKSARTEESEKSKVLDGARTQAGKWASVARRQDAMLQQEREAQKGVDMQSVFARHTSGAIFLQPPAVPYNDSSDDEAQQHWRRDPGASWQGNGSLTSSDEDDVMPKSRPGLASQAAAADHPASPSEASSRSSASPPISPAAKPSAMAGKRHTLSSSESEDDASTDPKSRPAASASADGKKSATSTPTESRRSASKDNASAKDGDADEVYEESFEESIAESEWST
eukprot:TRINITY_DN81995_c0_g1_i1.p1 TRINITY_DN81995_c0_g1~~TRINITY_DN81995_c0_g1_i1.p1  ORF type:complete len:411 (-),score=109.00 TRINITY_DN81995_c0_g1_i1:143-1375(-)